MGRGDVFLAFLGGLIAGSVLTRMFRSYRDWKAADKAVGDAWKAFRWLFVLAVVGFGIAVTVLRASESPDKPAKPNPSATVQQNQR